ncbi:hypothetical protein [Nonomuraea dietziae]|uniref:hypothetical protein n=1 Tax=Nonomuraea dietziae TaxID=65515 RepID=UPI0031CFAC14
MPTLRCLTCDGARASRNVARQCDAVCLFTERARAVLPSFALTEDNNKDVVVDI